ncbi:Hypothetical predicted protein [Mytilus galloprovincialis]|uniref:Uncharacterized protein n=1 Tax=Mytilus galloprovincialis TaxID=29158 RepID=A0A8B6FMC3_MYTGA|nr:Hypothetical predicted protein [Mytilus galloprovincialis]
MSGVGVAIGNETGKVLEREIRSKNCRTCSYWEGKGIEAAHHDCPRSWFGTSKGMEPDKSLLKSKISNSPFHVFISTSVLETTSLSLNCDIVQISAVNDMNVFDQYITPSSGISKYASEFTTTSPRCALCLKQSMVSKARLFTLKPLTERSVISTAMAKKISDSGLDLFQLQLAKRRDTDNGIRLVLAEKNTNGKPRVTACKRVATKISDYLN